MPRARTIRTGPRYAIYFVPPAASALYRFGASVLGHDCYEGRRLPAPALDGIGKARWETLTRAPRRYGFHATLKAPFGLRAGAGEKELVRELDSFAAARPPLPPAMLKIEMLKNFATLTPQEPSAAISGLAADCVEHFDRFRAPLPSAERAQRLAADLSERQIGHLDRYGYPYVLGDFRFHMTLTGPLPGAARDQWLASLRRKFEQDVHDRALVIGAISLVRQASGRARFRVVHQSLLGARSGH